ncbi:MAG: chorismate mutase [Lachnospiraceae bacterium]|nr:chorismate mutase [Lachnospiraceae bacterium]
MGLDKIRQEIDEVDTQMKALFLKRMELAYQVVEAKKQTGGAVYVPEREQAIITARSSDVEQELLPEYQSFIKQLMGISRTYQYSKLIDQTEKLKDLPKGMGEVTLEFAYSAKTDHFAVCLNAVSLAGLTVKEIMIEEKENKPICRLCLSGDFSNETAKAAVLLIVEENV